MNAPSPTGFSERRPPTPTWIYTTLSLMWHSVRILLAALLGILEPVVRIILTLLAVLSVFTALFFETVSRLPTRSLVALLGFALACAVVLVLYQRILLFLSR